MEEMEAQIKSLMQERDSALEMLVEAENEIMRTKDELRLSHITCPELGMRKQIEDMKHDYSDVISLLDSKCRSISEELYSTQEYNKKLLQEMETLKSQLSKRESELEESINELERVKKGRDELQCALEHCHHQLNEAIKSESQAREKVSEAIAMAEEALKKEALIIAEEKSKHERAINDLIDRAGDHMAEAINSIENELHSKIEFLQERLNAEIQEKNKLAIESMTIKADCGIKVKELQMENKNLINKLKSTEESNNKTYIEFGRERDTLRNQIISLKTALECIPEAKRQQQCKKCDELMNFATYYKDLAEKYKQIYHDLMDDYETILDDERKQWHDKYQKLINGDIKTDQ